MANALNDAKKLAKYNNQLEQANTKLQYNYNRSLAQEDRAWQERMANSAHQREIADLKAAGLNPVLSVTGGNGAATPSGSATSVSKPNVDMSLPRAVMDMAMAQLNSATALQTTAMNNATSRYMHDTLGANSLAGTIEYLSGYDFNGVAKKTINAITKDNFIGKLRNSAKEKVDTTYRKLFIDYLSASNRLADAKLGTKNYRQSKREFKKLYRQLQRFDKYSRFLS